MITPSFYLALATFTRQGQQLIGIQHETAVQTALYGALDDLHMREIARKGIRVSLISTLGDFKEALKEQRKSSDIETTRELIKDVELTAAMIEVLNG